MNETTKKYVVVTRDSMVFYVPSEDYQQFISQLNMGTSDTFLTVDGINLSIGWIAYHCTAEKYEENIRIRRGEWKCAKSHWHQADERCKEIDDEELKKKDRLVKLTDGTTMDINDILADQTKPTEEQVYVNLNAGKPGKPRWSKKVTS